MNSLPPWALPNVHFFELIMDKARFMNTEQSVARQPFHLLILLGPPGAGKGTQCKRLANITKLPHISMGDILRDNLLRNPELERKVKGLMSRGALVSDALVMHMLSERVGDVDCAEGFILDGLPRTTKQAQLLDLHLSTIIGSKKVLCVRVIRLMLDRASLIKRVANRRMCTTCGQAYNTRTRPPRIQGACDLDGAGLIMRDDDHEETVVERLKVYEEQILPIADFYSKQGNLFEIGGDCGVEDVTLNILSSLGGFCARRESTMDAI
jgi:adenylate kinase